ncbi:MAG: CapA family protein [Candidatus Eisenbacteria bacterium]|nr:CapA family protein [Candidatus Eisenbacteria bacterium]
MNRRDFLLRIPAAAAAIAIARRTRASEPGPSGALRDTASAPASPPDSARAEAQRSQFPAALIAAAGDTTLGYNLEAHFDALAASGISKDLLFSLYFSGVREILEWADLAMVNLECPFTERGEPLPKNFNFRARRELVEILRSGAVDAVTLANNHLMDFGEIGLSDTIDTLDDAKILHFGAGRDLDAARRPLIVERAGVRLGFIGYYFQDARDMREPRELYAAANRPGVAGCYTDLYCMRSMLDRDLAKLVPQVEAAIPFFHWGHEGSSEVRDYQIELAHRSVDLGCRAVLGAHPHRLQAIEVYRGAPVFYSLGNFVFGGNKDPEDKLSAIARLRVPKSGPVDADVVPIQITRWPDAAFQPFALEGEDKAAALARIAQISRGFDATLPQLAGASEEFGIGAEEFGIGAAAPVDSASTPHR